MNFTILLGDCRETLKTLPDCSVHCCVTSPPYFGLRDYGCDGQIGLEETPDAYVAKMVAVFREVRRVLREDGTLWLNLGDSYAGSWGAQGRPQGDGDLNGRSVASARQIGAHPRFEGLTGTRGKEIGLKPKDLMGIPWRVAFALQADGWYLRQEIIWHKPNPMPESVTDRCTKAHEQIFLLSKSPRYYFDAVAIQEQGTNRPPGNNHATKSGRANEAGDEKHRTSANLHRIAAAETRNKRSVWTVSTKPYKGAHFATFPTDLIEPCILAGTSEEGCCSECGAPWVRVTEKTFLPQSDVCEEKRAKGTGKGLDTTSGWSDTPRGSNQTKTVGWEQSCKCEGATAIPCTVLDPFGGSGTTAQVAIDNGCHAILCELNPEYVRLIKQRLQQRKLLVPAGV